MHAKGSLMQNLVFHETHSFPFAQTPMGGNIGMSLVQIDGDIVLAVCAQTTLGDMISYMDLCYGNEYTAHPTPPGIHRISGLGFNKRNELLYVASGLNNEEDFFAMEPGTGTIVGPVQRLTPSINASGLGISDWFAARAGGDTIEIRTLTGALVAQKQFPGRRITGITHSPWSWTFTDFNNLTGVHEIVVIDLFGNEVATCPAPGAMGPNPIDASMAIAFDYVHDNMDQVPQLCPPENGYPPGFNPIGTAYDGGVPWTPEPWHFKHKLYVGNNYTNRVHVGYMTLP